LLSLEAFLVNATRQNKRCLLIVDEAQNLTSRAVEELRMLSNFQFGSYSLLQTFLIGQPEFRNILQSAEMLQLRQRVIATCHINPMDREETQGYIQHRLKCAGAKESPTFDEAAFDAIFLRTGGVPRRINTLCDRLLLYGYLAGKTAFTREDVQEIIREMDEESRARPASRAPAPHAGGGGEQMLDIGGVSLDIDPQVVDEASAIIASMGSDQLGERLLRLERGMLRLERINSATLTLVQQLLEAARAARQQG
jgi:hypothetical protein